MGHPTGVFLAGVPFSAAGRIAWTFFETRSVPIGPLKTLLEGGKTMAKGKILVVDDEEDVRDVIKLHLEPEGYNIIEAEDGEKAISVLRSEDNMINVGVILCDIRMPKVNGVECVDFLKKEAPGVPVVMVTGYPDTEMAISFLNKGVKDYLVKPVEKEKLLGVVGKMVANGKDIGL